MTMAYVGSLGKGESESQTVLVFQGDLVRKTCTVPKVLKVLSSWALLTEGGSNGKK